MINTLRKNCLAQESPCQIVLVHPICCFFLWGYFATKQLYFMKTSEQWYTCAELYDWIAIVLYSIMLQNILQFLKIFFLLLKGRAGHKFGSVNSVTWQQCCGSEWIRNFCLEFLLLIDFTCCLKKSMGSTSAPRNFI